MRNVIEIRGEALVEMYLYKVRVTYLKRPEVVDAEDYKASIPQMSALEFSVSRKATISDLRRDFFEAFEISEIEAQKLALYNYLDDTKGDVLEDYVDERDSSQTTWKENGNRATIHSCRIVDTQTLLIDLKPSPEELAQHTLDTSSSSASLFMNPTSAMEITDDTTLTTASSAQNGDSSISPSGSHQIDSTASNMNGLTATTIAAHGAATQKRTRWPTLPEFFSQSNPSSQALAFPRGVCGLRNLGNTCFMNSALQCLSATEPLMEYFVTGRFQSEINKTNPLGKGGELAMEFGKLVARMWAAKESSIVPRDFKWMLGNFAKRFDDFSQQDSQELLAFLLDGLHEDCNRIFSKPATPSVSTFTESDQSLIVAADKSWQYYKQRNDSAVVDMFQAQLKSKLECPDCGYLSITFDPYMYLSLPIPTDSIRTKEVLFNFRGGLLRCALQLPRNSLMSQVKTQLQQLTGVSSTRIVLADVHSSKIHKKFHNNDRFDSVSNGDQLVAFELNYDITKPLIGKIIVPVYQRVLTPSWDQKSGRFFYIPHCVGLPMFVMVDKHITYGDLWLSLKQQISTHVDMNHPSMTSKKFPFTISRIKSNGSTLQHLEEWRGGSATHHANKAGNSATQSAGQNNNTTNMTPTEARHLHVVILQGDILSVDWDLSVCSGGASMGPRILQIKDHPLFSETIASGAALASKPVSLDDCFTAFTKPETLDGGNAWKCPSCSVEREATKTISIWTLPNVLVIHLKRFTETIYNRQKLNNLIQYPVHQLDLAPYLAKRPEGCHDDRDPFRSSTPHSDASEDENDGNENSGEISDKSGKVDSSHSFADASLEFSTKYELFAISNHYGGLGGGHYTAMTRNFVNGVWYEFDDAQAHKITNEKELVNPSAYVLFYRRLPLSSVQASDPAALAISAATASSPSSKL